MDKCIRCTDTRKHCNVLGLLSLPSTELGPLCKKRKQFLGVTAQNVADRSNVPIGTVNRFFSGELGDFRYDTAQRIVKVLWEVAPGECPEEHAPIIEDASEVKVLREINAHQAATIKHQDEQIRRLHEQIDRKDEYIDRLAKKAGI